MRIEQESLRHSHKEVMTTGVTNGGAASTRYWGCPGEAVGSQGSAKAINLSFPHSNGHSVLFSMETLMENCLHTETAGDGSYNRPHSLSTNWYIKF